MEAREVNYLEYGIFNSQALVVISEEKFFTSIGEGVKIGKGR